MNRKQIDANQVIAYLMRNHKPHYARFVERMHEIFEKTNQDVSEQINSEEMPDNLIHFLFERIEFHFGVSEDQLKHPSKGKITVSDTRQMFYWIAKRFTNLTLKAIGEHINRSYSNVLQGIQRADEKYRIDNDFKDQLDLLITDVESTIGITQK